MIMVLLFQGENFGEAVAFWMQPQGLKGKRLAREWKRINRCHIIARSSGINHFLNRAVPTLFWATADIFNAFGPVLHKKLIKIVTGMAKELICYPNAGQLANEVCYRVVKHLVSFKVRHWKSSFMIQYFLGGWISMIVTCFSRKH